MNGMDHDMPAVVTSMDERRASRRKIRVDVHMTETSCYANPVTMTDISEHGCRLEREGQSVIGRLVEIEVPNFTTLLGWVVWSSANAVGIDFSNPIRTEVVDHIGTMRNGEICT